MATVNLFWDLALESTQAAINWKLPDLVEWKVSVIEKNNVAATGWLLCWQAKVSVTWTAVQLPNIPVSKICTITALDTNTANITYWPTAITNTSDWTGNWAILQSWSSVVLPIRNLNEIYINWTANNIISYNII